MSKHSVPAPATTAPGTTASAPAPRIGMVWAQTTAGVIGKDGGLPWHLPEDMAHFKRTTMGHPVIMGRRTWESIPERFRPFSGRTNIVLTSDAATAAEATRAGAAVVRSLAQALEVAAGAEGSEEVWILGGGQIFAAHAEDANTAMLTIINEEIAGDTHAPALSAAWTRTMAEPEAGWLVSRTGLEYRYELWERTA